MWILYRLNTYIKITWYISFYMKTEFDHWNNSVNLRCRVKLVFFTKVKRVINVNNNNHKNISISMSFLSIESILYEKFRIMKRKTKTLNDGGEEDTFSIREFPPQSLYIILVWLKSEHLNLVVHFLHSIWIQTVSILQLLCGWFIVYQQMFETRDKEADMPLKGYSTLSILLYFITLTLMWSTMMNSINAFIRHPI